MDLDVLVCEGDEDVSEEGGGGSAAGYESVVMGGSGGCIEGGEEVGQEVRRKGGCTEARGGKGLGKSGGCSLKS